MVGEQEVRTGLAGLRDDRECRVHSEVDASHGLVRVARDEPDPVPGLGALGRVEAVDHGDHLAQTHRLIAHVGPAGIEPTTYAV